MPTLQEIAAAGAFDGDLYKQETRAMRNDPSCWATLKTWAMRPDLQAAFNPAPTPTQIVDACIEMVMRKPMYYGKPVTDRTFAKILGLIADATGMRPALFTAPLEHKVMSSRSLTDSSLPETYNEMRAQRLAAVDRQLYQGLIWVPTDSGYQVLRATGEGREYAVVGTDHNDVYRALTQMPAPDGTDYANRHSYADELIRRMIIACAEHSPTAQTLTGLPASALDTLIRLKPEIEEKEIVGWELTYKGGSIPTIAKLIEASFDAWVAVTPPAEVPVALSNDPNVPCYCYIDLNRWQHGNCDTWLNWLKSTAYEDMYESNRDTMAAWMYAATVAGNKTKQMLWLHGAGNDGKSPVLHAILSVFGRHAGTLDVSQDSDHASTQIVGKAILAVSDSKNPNLARQSLVQKITGQDDVLINPKGKDVYTYKAHSKIIVAENLYPSVCIHDKGQVSRILLIDLRSRSIEEQLALGIAKRASDGTVSFAGDSSFEDRLIAELPAFLAIGKDVYEAMDTTGNIPQTAMMQYIIKSSCVDFDDNTMYDAVRTWFEVDPTAMVDRKIIQTLIRTNYPPKMSSDTSWAFKIIRYLFPKAEETMRRIDGEPTRVFTGIKLTAAGRLALAGNPDEANQPKQYGKPYRAGAPRNLPPEIQAPSAATRQAWQDAVGSWSDTPMRAK